MGRIGHRRECPRDRERGIATIEFAVVLGLLCAVLFGIMEYGWMFFQQSNVAAAAREGARAGVVVPPAAQPDAVATAVDRATAVLAQLRVDTNGATIAASYAGALPQRTLTVTVRVPYKQLVGFVPVPQSLGSSMTMLLEQQR